MKKSTVFYKIFLPMFLLGAVLVIGFSLFIYQNTYESIESSYLTDKRICSGKLKLTLNGKLERLNIRFLRMVRPKFLGHIQASADIYRLLHLF